MSKRIICPALCGVGTSLRGTPMQWGLVEYMQDVLLPNALGSVELCDFVLRVGEQLKDQRGEKQVGLTLEFTDDDWGLLCRLVRTVQPPPDPLNLMAYAMCNRAILLAATPEPAKAAE